MRGILILLSVFVFLGQSVFGFLPDSIQTQNASFKVIPPKFSIESIPANYILKTDLDFPLNERVLFTVDGNIKFAKFIDKQYEFEYLQLDNRPMVLEVLGKKIETVVKPVPLWVSIIPPIIAIILALIFKEVIISLFLGIFVGGAILHVYADGFSGIFSGFLATIQDYILPSLNDSGHLSVILFSMIIGAMVSVISRNGGMQGVVNYISKFAKNAKTGQLATWILGVAIFFDDYANTLVVGNTMRPVTDRLRVSREKLAYIVDSTAAPIAAIAFVTTWIGAELGYIQDGIKNLDINENAYNVFINSLQYSFYPIFTLAFILMIILMNKDYGPMLKAENRARIEGKVEGDKVTISAEEVEKLQPMDGIRHNPWNAVIPVLVVIFGTIIGLLVTGWDSEVWNDDQALFSRKLSHIIGNADSYVALLWSSLSALSVAILMSVSFTKMKIDEAIDSMLNGFKTMLPTIIILVLAWSLALITEHLHTADFITNLLGDSFPPILFPAITFLLAAGVAFSTGSSWGTMAILYPLMLPAVWQICQQTGMDYDQSLSIFHNVVSCVLAGSVLGDHCSPISDTTILSSLASSCNHISHVKTQMPYALTVGTVAIFVGTIPAAAGVSSLITIPVGLIILYLIVKFYGKDVAIAKNSTDDL